MHTPSEGDAAPAAGARGERAPIAPAANDQPAEGIYDPGSGKGPTSAEQLLARMSYLIEVEGMTVEGAGARAGEEYHEATGENAPSPSAMKLRLYRHRRRVRSGGGGVGRAGGGRRRRRPTIEETARTYDSRRPPATEDEILVRMVHLMRREGLSVLQAAIRGSVEYASTTGEAGPTANALKQRYYKQAQVPTTSTSGRWDRDLPAASWLSRPPGGGKRLSATERGGSRPAGAEPRSMREIQADMAREQERFDAAEAEYRTRMRQLSEELLARSLA